MTKTRFSHAACQHPSTKAGRAGCRKALRAAAAPQAESTPKAAATKKAAPKDPTKKAATETPAPAEKVEETPAPVEPQEVTRETWREFKEQRVTVHVVGVEEPFTDLELTGWSIKLIQFKDADGKSHRLPATTVEKVTTV